MKLNVSSRRSLQSRFHSSFLSCYDTRRRMMSHCWREKNKIKWKAYNSWVSWWEHGFAFKCMHGESYENKFLPLLLATGRVRGKDRCWDAVKTRGVNNKAERQYQGGVGVSAKQKLQALFYHRNQVIWILYIKKRKKKKEICALCMFVCTHYHSSHFKATVAPNSEIYHWNALDKWWTVYFGRQL